MSNDKDETRIQQAARENVEEIQQRIDEIDDEIDYQQCCDPNYTMSEREKDLFWEMEKLLASRTQLEKVAEDGVP